LDDPVTETRCWAWCKRWTTWLTLSCSRGEDQGEGIASGGSCFQFMAFSYL
jgi:hypothetical protein